MSKELEQVGYLLVIVLVLAGVFSLGYSFILNYNSQLEQINYLEDLEMDYVRENNQIYEYYSLASEAYDVDNYEKVIDYCETSRDVSREYSQYLREIKVEYPKETGEVLKHRKKMIELEIKFLFALYEACEYLESSARAYDNENYQNGHSNIDLHNEKIELHDNLLEEYYNMESEYKKLKRDNFS